jgi:hypothetical protein
MGSCRVTPTPDLPPRPARVSIPMTPIYFHLGGLNLYPGSVASAHPTR